MSQNGYDFGSQEQHYNRSCNSKIENDILNQNEIDESFKFKTVRSQKQLKTFKEQQQELQNMVRDNQLRQLKKVLNKQQDKKVQQEQQTQTRVFKLGENVINSESISVYQETLVKENPNRNRSASINQNSSSNNNEQSISKKQKNVKDQSSNSEETLKKIIIKQINLNVLLLGKSGLGKTSFVDCFLDKKYENIPIIRQKTQQVITKNYETINGNNKYKINLIDMPGYQQVKVSQYIKEVTESIKNKYRNHLQIMKVKKDLSKDNKQEFVDERIHCCLFFLSGPWVSDYDWEIMKKIQNITNIIPIIARGDTFTTSELREFKKNIAFKQKMCNINWFSIQQNIRQSFQDKLGKLLEGPFGKAPPFVITCCNQKQVNQKNNNFELVRIFRWGKCELQNQAHNDFKLLKQLIFNLSSILIKYTDTNLRSYEEDEYEKSNEPLRDHSQYIPLSRSLHVQAQIESKAQEQPNNYKMRFITYFCLTGLGLIAFYKQKARLS